MKGTSSQLYSRRRALFERALRIGVSRPATWRPAAATSGARERVVCDSPPAGNRSEGGQAGASQNGDVYVPSSPAAASDYDAQVKRRRERSGFAWGAVRDPDCEGGDAETIRVMAATPTTTSCWGCFRWRQLQQERSSRESTLSFRPSHGASYNQQQQQQQGPHAGGDFQPRAHHHYPFPERPQLEQPTSQAPGPSSQPGSVHRLSFPPSGIERHLARLHRAKFTVIDRWMFHGLQVSDTDSGLGRTITAETSEESFAGAVAAPQAPPPPPHRLCGGNVCNGIYRASGAVAPGGATGTALGGGPDAVMDDGLAHEMALLRVELEIVRWECESIIRQKRRRDQDLLGSWSRRRRVLDWMQRHDSSDTSYDPSTLSSNSEDRREASPSPTSSVEALCSRTPPPSCAGGAPESPVIQQHIYESVARSPSPLTLVTSSPHVRSQSMTLNNNPPSGPTGRVLSPEHKRCSSASPVRRKMQAGGPVPAVLSPVRTYRFSCTINESPQAPAAAAVRSSTRSPSCSPVRHSAAFRPRCSSNPVPHAVTPAVIPIVTSRTAGQISDLYRRQEHTTSCFPTQSIPESPLALHSTSSSPIPIVTYSDRSPAASPVRFQHETGGSPSVMSPCGGASRQSKSSASEDKPRRWFDSILQQQDPSPYQVHEPAQLCSFYSPQRQCSKSSSSRLQPVLEGECYGGRGARSRGGGILDLDLEFVTKDGGGAAQRAKKTRRQLRRERAQQIAARTRADTTTSTDSDATLKHHHSSCHACARSRRKAGGGGGLQQSSHRSSPSRHEAGVHHGRKQVPMTHHDDPATASVSANTTDYML
ncbi:hypothetical protein HPB50_004900 [Hyalomma asiaticum]|uniref:Uncharacterized protein n=1 Tax=Hyalomma asiaticum TaxID=266040 RepID=A0ACB7RJH2_HYAAI|nr:hypothetical protein HPB50_004900 [Hyalomma asiaticum]